VTADPAEPLAAISDPGRALPGQIARFGQLAGRDLSARAMVTLRQRGAYDPQRHRDAGDYQPLTTAEQAEMLALRTAIGHGHRPAAPRSATDAGQSNQDGFQRLASLRRRPAPGPRRAPGRHHRVTDSEPLRVVSRAETPTDAHPVS
jgi:hypothetical protein